MPSSSARGPRPRFNAPITDVVMPEECQSIPMTDPSAWNQKGSLRRERKADVPYSRTIVSVIAVPRAAMRSASHCGTRPPCRGRSATPERFMNVILSGFAHVQMAEHLNAFLTELVDTG